MNELTTFVVRPNGEELNLSILLSELKWARKMKWTKTFWKPKPALIELQGKSSRQYIGQKYDKKYFKIKEDGWRHEHCDICTKGIYENDAVYISDNQIICESCHLEFIVPKNLDDALKEMKIVKR
ncbi:MAG: hypothetical protein R3342_13055 [Lutibacter sp.]|uniref:hypothetical protein n=1 Tax=Lutibacter sp. TaxID=1925666 RepID=UPI00299DE811|nr:hypothetical protein [Lutibacter sp.]MDX1830461.1 hypothetical protein [Lutibacter sp.]